LERSPKPYSAQICLSFISFSRKSPIDTTLKIAVVGVDFVQTAMRRRQALGCRPPYLPYSTFERALEVLSRRPLAAPEPGQMVLGFSDAQYSALISALRFLGLVGPDRIIASAGHTQMGRLLATRQRGRGEYRQCLLPLLKRAYRPILGAIDFERGTRADLEIAFVDVGGVLPGQMLARSIRFFGKAVNDCGVTVSPDIT
jgi:hypothetical protein